MALESLDSVLAKRDSFEYMWELLNPAPEFRERYIPCMRVWNKLPHRAQQRMYWYIRKKKRLGEIIYDDPLYALTYITPVPENCNGRRDLDQLIKSTPMVSAFYNGKYGIYTLCESTIFEMTNIKRLN